MFVFVILTCKFLNLNCSSLMELEILLDLLDLILIKDEDMKHVVVA